MEFTQHIDVTNKPEYEEMLGTAKRITLQRDYGSNRSFSRINVINTKNKRSYSADIFEKLVRLSKPAQDLFILIKREMSFKTYIANIGLDGLTRSQKNIRSKAITELESAGLALRLPRKITVGDDDVTSEIKFRAGSYMLSPDAIFPANQHEAIVRKYWDAALKYSRANQTQSLKI